MDFQINKEKEDAVEEKNTHSTVYVVIVVIAVLIVGMFIFYIVGKGDIVMEREKSNIADDMRKVSDSLPKLTDQEKAEITEEMRKVSDSLPKLTDQEKAEIIESMRTN